jgi:hypothetical protein
LAAIWVEWAYAGDTDEDVEAIEVPKWHDSDKPLRLGMVRSLSRACGM